MSNPLRFLTRRRVYVSLGALALLIGLAMLHPYPRQSLFGPTIRGKPWCVWEGKVRWHLHREEYEKGEPARIARLLGVLQDEMDANELFDDAEMAPLLLHLSEDPNPVVRQRAICQFYWFKNLQDKSALPTLRGRLHDEDPRCRIEAAMAVVTIEPDERVHPVLLQILDDATNEYRYPAMRALAFVACASDEAFGAMLHFAKDLDPNIRKEVMFELFRHGKKAVPTLMQGLEDPDPMVRKDAVESLEQLGPRAAQTIPMLRRLQNDKDKRVRDAAVVALASVEPEGIVNLKPRKK
jgi:HEAT repeat protein